MRSTLLALLVVLGAVPAGARADLTLRLTAFDGPDAPSPRQQLEVPGARRGRVLRDRHRPR